MSDGQEITPSQQQQSNAAYAYEPAFDRTNEIEQHLFEGRRARVAAVGRQRDGQAGGSAPLTNQVD